MLDVDGGGVVLDVVGVELVVAGADGVTVDDVVFAAFVDPTGFCRCARFRKLAGLKFR